MNKQTQIGHDQNIVFWISLLLSMKLFAEVNILTVSGIVL